MKRNKRRRKCPFSPLTLLAALLLIGGMLAVVLPVLQWDAEVSAEAGEYEQLREQNRQAEARETVEEETPNQHAAPPVSLAEEGSTVQQSENAVGEQAAQVTVDLSACLAQNPDFIAWLRIPGTNVDYPVVQTDNPDYYLNHTFSGKSSVVGTLFSLADADYQRRDGTSPSTDITCAAAARRCSRRSCGTRTRIFTRTTKPSCWTACIATANIRFLRS